MKDILPFLKTALSQVSDHKRWAFSVCLAGLFGAVFFFVIYGELINPTYVDWLLTERGDPGQQYIGWSFFRNAEWNFPFGRMDNYGYPIGISVSYTDSLPLLALPFKLLRSVLPEQFQYFGFWILICLVLQGVFGSLLLKTYTKNYVVSILGSIFFIISPIILFRLGGHTALGSHWIILASLWLLFREHTHIQTWQWSLIFFFSLLVHPFLFFLSGFILVADILRLVWVEHTVGWKKVGVFIFFEFLFVLVVCWSVGLLYVGNGASDGYGAFSMNLNALVNPWGWSRILPDLPIARFQYEGMNYLGFGALLLLVCSCGKFLFDKQLVPQVKKYWPLIVIFLILTLLAISHVVMFGLTELVTIPLPEKIIREYLGVLRASGRLFWPVYYSLLLFSFYLLKQPKKLVVLSVLCIALTLQIYDMSNNLRDIDKRYEKRVWKDVLVSDYWDIAARSYAHISFIPNYSFDYEPIAYYAMQHGLTLNTGYFSRPMKGNNSHIQQEIDQLMLGRVQEDTLYVFFGKVFPYVLHVDERIHPVIEVDGFTLLTAYGNMRIPEHIGKRMTREELKQRDIALTNKDER